MAKKITALFLIATLTLLCSINVQADNQTGISTSFDKSDYIVGDYLTLTVVLNTKTISQAVAYDISYNSDVVKYISCSSGLAVHYNNSKLAFNSTGNSDVFTATFKFECISPGKATFMFTNVASASEYEDSYSGTATSKTIAATIKGDVNNDRNVNTIDLSILKLVLSGILTVEDTEVVNPDIDGKGEATTTDLSILKLLLAGVET